MIAAFQDQGGYSGHACVTVNSPNPAAALRTANGAFYYENHTKPGWYVDRTSQFNIFTHDCQTQTYNVLEAYGANLPTDWLTPPNTWWDELRLYGFK